jgi:hypothetical protein
MTEDKIMKMLGIGKIVFTLIFMIAMVFVEPVFLYILAGAVIITIPIVLVFSFITKIYESEKTK